MLYGSIVVQQINERVWIMLVNVNCSADDISDPMNIELSCSREELEDIVLDYLKNKFNVDQDFTAALDCTVVLESISELSENDSVDALLYDDKLDCDQDFCFKFLYESAKN